MTILTPIQIAYLANAVGWPWDKVGWVIAVAFAESSWDTEAVHPNSNGTTDYGLMQVNTVHKNLVNFFPPSDKWKDPATNLMAAKSVWDVEGDAAWNSSLAGHDDKIAVGNAAAQQAQAQPLPQEIVDSIKNGVSITGIIVDGSGQTTTQVGGVVTDALSNIFSLDGLGKYMWIGGGAVLVILGVVLYFKSDIISVAKVAAL